MNPPFERTICACDQCVQCCKKQPGPLAPSDIAKISSIVTQPLKELLCDSPGALAKFKEEKIDVIRRIRTIVPQMRQGKCVFLTEDNKCGIHAVAPFGCAYFDTHMEKEEGQKRSVWLHTEIIKSAEYFELRQKLPLAKTYKPRGY